MPKGICIGGPKAGEVIDRLEVTCGAYRYFPLWIQESDEMREVGFWLPDDGEEPNLHRVVAALIRGYRVSACFARPNEDHV